MYGVLRPSEIIDCKITDYECAGNHINISTKQTLIHHHKNDRNGTKIIDVEDKSYWVFLGKVWASISFQTNITSYTNHQAHLRKHSKQNLDTIRMTSAK